MTSSNGHVQTRDVEGPARIRTSNAAVRANNTKGILEIETSNGAIDVNDHAGAVTGRTSNGRIHVELANPEQGTPIRLESSNGGITLRMRSLNGNNIRLSTSNASNQISGVARWRGRSIACQYFEWPHPKRPARARHHREESCGRQDRRRRTLRRLNHVER